jgi:alkylation response protein AidB-like acyl-CoA dehydrogenase
VEGTLTVDFSESDEHAALRKSVAALASTYGSDYFFGKARAGEKQTELWQAMGQAGYLGVNVPEEYGGGGGGVTELAIVMEELSAAGCPLLLMVVSPAICATVIAAFGTVEQKERWLPGFATGELIMSFAITEPDAGSNTHALTTNAVRDGDEWVLNGAKYWISGVDEADDVLVVARTGTDDRGRGALSLFVVPTDAAGLSATILPADIVAPEKQFSLHFDDVRLPADALVGTEGQGLRQVFLGLNPERILGAASAAGSARAAIDKAVAYAKARQVWGVPIGAHQGLAHPLAACKVSADLARLMMQKAAWLHDTGSYAASAEASNMAKYAAAEAALAAIDQAIQVHGGNGLSQDFGLLAAWGNARLARTAPVSREMVLNHVAQHSLGLPKSY